MDDNDPSDEQVHVALSTYLDIEREWSEWETWQIESMRAALNAVLAKGSEWEYGIRLNQTSTAGKVILWPEHEAVNPFSGTRVRRIPAVPAGPWVPVKQEGKPS